MSLTINIYYKGENGNARRFAEEMVSSGIVEEIRAKEGNVRYEYFFPMDDAETVLLIDQWRDQKALDAHHASGIMGRIMDLRNKYDLHMKVERFIPAEENAADEHFIMCLWVTQTSAEKTSSVAMGSWQHAVFEQPSGPFGRFEWCL